MIRNYQGGTQRTLYACDRCGEKFVVEGVPSPFAVPRGEYRKALATVVETEARLEREHQCRPKEIKP